MPPANKPKRSALEQITLAENGAPRHARALVRAAASRLQAAGVETAMLDAGLLLAAALGVSRERLIAGLASPDDEALAHFGEMLARREAREPLAYILGSREFFSLDLEVTPDVLIPRPETETLVTAALALGVVRKGGLIADVGTGSGAIAIALAVHAPGARIVATDISPTALAVARRNAQRIGCALSIEFLDGNCFEALERAGFGQCFDLIVSNPPYIEDSMLERLAPEVRGYEPRMALIGGPDGMDLHRRIAAGAGRFLKPGGEALIEVGAGQADAVASMWRRAGCMGTEEITDLAGVARVVHAWF